MRTMLFLFALALASAIVVASPTVAMAAGTMGGTTFTGTWVPDIGSTVGDVTADCTDPANATSGTVTYRSHNGVDSTSTAVASGTNPGFYFELGTVTIVNGVITAWDVGWGIDTVINGENYVSGRKHLNAAGTSSFSCASGSATGSLNATLDYSATYQPFTPRPPGTPETGSDSGLATASLNFTTTSAGDPAGAGWSSGTFSEIFLSTLTRAPTKKDECKYDGYAIFPMFKNQGECIAFVNHLP
jgi:hypothetical protein